jgi:hypothetical protein
MSPKHGGVLEPMRHIFFGNVIIGVQTTASKSFAVLVEKNVMIDYYLYRESIETLIFRMHDLRTCLKDGLEGYG